MKKINKIQFKLLIANEKYEKIGNLILNKFSNGTMFYELEFENDFYIENNDKDKIFNFLFPQYLKKEVDENFKFFLSNSIENYLSNSLPEGPALDLIKERNNIKEEDFFKLIKIIKNDFLGKFSFFANEEELEKIKQEMLYLNSLKRNLNYRDDLFFLKHLYRIKDEELLIKIKQEKTNKGSLILWKGNEESEKPRLSVAGFQSKLNVVYDKKTDALFLPTDVVKSNYILKINDNSNKNLVLNEYFHLKLAKEMGINVSNCIFKKIEDENILLIERFDRNPIEHVIDGCVLLNVLVEEKFQLEENSHVSFKEIIKKVKTTLKTFEDFNDCKFFQNDLDEPKQENCHLSSSSLNLSFIEIKKEMLKHLFFNVLIDNVDYHAKNISFYYDINLSNNDFKNSIENINFKLAPLYDVVNIGFYPEFNKQYALFVGKTKKKTELNSQTLYDLAEIFELQLEEVIKEYEFVKNGFLKIKKEDFLNSIKNYDICEVKTNKTLNKEEVDFIDVLYEKIKENVLMLDMNFKVENKKKIKVKIKP